MKQLISTLAIIGLLGCNRHPGMDGELQSRIDSLENALADSYKPGFGEFMSAIQAHHAKLWYAGQNQNWKLADFEIHELMEAIEDIKHYQTGREESRMIVMISPALDSVGSAVTRENLQDFKHSFTGLTNACNTCHRETEFGFNVVKIPEGPSFPNQDFSISR
jgi:hypothetical protein